MEINLFHTNVEELNTKLAGTVWQVDEVQLTVQRVFVDGYTGGYCARFADNSWAYVSNLLEKAQQVIEPAVMDELAYLIYARDENIFWTENEEEAISFEAELIKCGIQYNAFNDGFKNCAAVKYCFEIN